MMKQLKIFPLEWDLTEDAANTMIELAAKYGNKDFLAHPYCQQYFDARWYAEKVVVTTDNYIVDKLAIVMPPLFYEFVDKSKRHSIFDVLALYNIPRVKFFWNTLFYIAYLILLGLVASPKFTFEFTYYEIALYIWILTIIVDEIYQYRRNPSRHFALFDNQFDFLIEALYVIIFILRVVGILLMHERLTYSCHMILVFNTIFSYLRLLGVLAASLTMGPIYFAIRDMLKDVLKFLIIFGIVFSCFWIAFTAVLREKSDTVDPSTYYTLYPTGSLLLPLWAIFGEFSSSLAYINETSTIGLILLALYLLISQILMVNLLIAMMNDSYSRVKDSAEQEFKAAKHDLLVEYEENSWLPPPLNVIFLGYRFYKYIMSFSTCIARVPKPETASVGEKLELLNVKRWEYLLSTANESKVEEKIDDIMTKLLKNDDI